MRIVKTEMFDPDVAEVILRDPGFSKKSRERLGRYIKSRSHANQVRVLYCYGKRWEDIQFGRLYPKDDIGLQAFPFDIRNPLLEKYYWDVDMVNCHYVILAKMADDWGLPTEAIHQYIDNRDAELAKVSSVRKIAKTAFLKIAYGGNIKLYDDRYDDDGVVEGDMTLIRRIEKEMTSIVDRVWTEYKHLHSKVRGTNNPKFSLFANVLQNEEQKCLRAMDLYFQSKGRSMDVLIHDGGSVRKLEGETELHQGHLVGAGKAILDATGYVHSLLVKAWEHGFKMPEQKTQEVPELINDDYASKVFVGLMGTHVCRIDKAVYYFNELNGLWETGEEAFRRAVHKHKEALVFREKIESALGTRYKVHDYSGTEKKVVAMRAFIKNYVPERNLFSEKELESNYYKLLFKNGIFDFRTGFTEGFNEDIIFQRRINRDFPVVRDEEKESEVRDILFQDPFKVSEVGLFLLKTLVIGMVGDYSRKKFYFGLGPTNCGKGVLTNALKMAFDGYVDEWNADELLYNSKTGMDRAKRMAWVQDLQGRLAFSNEIKMERTAIDMNLVKSVSGGGDNIMARKNFQDQSPIVCRSMMFLLANDLPEFAPKDVATNDRCVFVPYEYSFTNGEITKPKQKKANPSVKNMFLKEDYQNALFWLFASTFQSMTEEEKAWGGKILPPALVLEETLEYSGDGSAELNDVFLEKYEITNDPTDRVLSSQVCRYLLDERRLRYSKQKISKMVISLIELSDKEDVKVLIGKQRLAGFAGVRER